MPRSSDIYYKNNYFYIVSNEFLKQPDSSLGYDDFPSNPMIKISSEKTAKEIGEAALFSLNSYRERFNRGNNINESNELFEFLEIPSKDYYELGQIRLIYFNESYYETEDEEREFYLEEADTGDFDDVGVNDIRFDKMPEPEELGKALLKYAQSFS